MALTDDQIVSSAVFAGNSDYVLPGGAEFTLKAVNASFTDNGAASDWLPAVVLISDSQHVIARALDQGVKVTAGQSAEVSFFPGVKHAATASTGTALSWAFMAQTVNPFADTGGFEVDIDLDTASFLTSDAGTYATGVSGGHHGIQINAQGTYLVTTGAEAFPAAAPAAGSILKVAVDNFGAVNFVSPIEISPYYAIGGGSFQGNCAQTYLIEVGVIANPVGTVALLQAGQNTGGNVDLSVGLTVVMLGTSIP